MKYGGDKPSSEICGLTSLHVSPDLFANLTPDCKPISIKSRKYSPEDKKFISHDIQRMLSEDIIEHSNSPWRAQVLVTGGTYSTKKRLVTDYSQTVNHHTQLDAYPLPHIDELVNKLAQYRVFSTIDLKSAYHQVELKEADKPYLRQTVASTSLKGYHLELQMELPAFSES